MLINLIRSANIHNSVPVSVDANLIQWSLLLGYLHSVFNPFIYYLRQRNFRNGTIEILRKFRRNVIEKMSP